MEDKVSTNAKRACHHHLYHIISCLANPKDSPERIAKSRGIDLAARRVGIAVHTTIESTPATLLPAHLASEWIVIRDGAIVVESHHAAQQDIAREGVVLPFVVLVFFATRLADGHVHLSVGTEFNVAAVVGLGTEATGFEEDDLTGRVDTFEVGVEGPSAEAVDRASILVGIDGAVVVLLCGVGKGNGMVWR